MNIDFQVKKVIVGSLFITFAALCRTPTNEDNLLQCGDGTTCDAGAAYEGDDWENGWNCCANHEGRARCPKNYPLMCATENACS